ncbi:unnamed protein product, partial [Tuber aestivum]
VLELGEGWVNIYDPDRPWRHHIQTSEEFPTAIYYSALLDLTSACSLLVNRKEGAGNVNAQGGRYGNALQAAVCRGNESIVQLLLERGADVNAQGG